MGKELHMVDRFGGNALPNAFQRFPQGQVLPRGCRICCALP